MGTSTEAKPENHVMTKGEFLKIIDDMAVLYRKDGIEKSLKRNRHMHKWKGKGYDQDFVDALLVDFINYCGMFQGVDYCIYSRDLSWENFKPSCNLIHPAIGCCMHPGRGGKKCQKKGCPCWTEDDRGVGKVKRWP